jgi:hypothetical protein
MHMRFGYGVRLVLAMVVAQVPVTPVPPKPNGSVVAGITNAEGLRLSIVEEDFDPALRVLLPWQSSSKAEMVVLFPEHVTAKKKGAAEAEHLYLFRPGQQNPRPTWRQKESSYEYERDFSGDIHMLARATLEDDGVLFHYEFENRSDVDYAMITAVTDPRMTGVFHDARLERTYVHRKDGFGLLAADTPERLTMAMKEWLPVRYLDSYTWPIPAQRVERRADGITYYNASQPVDEPMIATVSNDQKWVAASFTKMTGNVWSNPELTCQHVDPERPLPPRAKAGWDVKLLVFEGTLDQALEKVKAQRPSLQ